MPLYKAEALVIRRTNLGEADRIVTLFTRERGKLAVVAKGARKPKSRFAGRLELFTHLHLLLAVGRSLDVVSQVDVIEAFALLRTDLSRLGYASLVAEAVDRATADHEPSPEVFNLARTTLELLQHGDDERAAMWFVGQLLLVIGYGPNVERCGVCGRQLNGACVFSAALGGTLCEEDRGRDPAAVAMTPQIRRTLTYLLAATPATLSRLAMDERTRTEISELLQRYLEYRLEIRLRTPIVIGKLRAISDRTPQP